MNKKVVYTSIYGEKSILGEPYVLSEGFDHICFTDNKDLKSKNYEILICFVLQCKTGIVLFLTCHPYLITGTPRSLIFSLFY